VNTLPDNLEGELPLQRTFAHTCKKKLPVSRREAYRLFIEWCHKAASRDSSLPEFLIVTFIFWRSATFLQNEVQQNSKVVPVLSYLSGR